MHFTVLVIGEDTDSQLSPFSSHTEVAPYPEDCWNCPIPPAEDPDPECKECGGTGTHLSTTNPKAEWDWYEVGGRWTGFFLPKPGRKGLLGTNGVFDREAPEGYVDQIKAGDVDWERMRIRGRRQAEENWDKAMEACSPDLDEVESNWTYGIRTGDTKKRYVARQSESRTYAVIKNYEWHTGDTGWGFEEGPNKDAQEKAWKSKFKSLLSGVDPDTMLTLVDCHM
jgi:hypothetical protein